MKRNNKDGGTDHEDFPNGFSKSREKKNLDMEDIMDNRDLAIKSAIDFRASGVSGISGDSSSQLQISEES